MAGKWLFTPYVSVGPIKFGMSREDVKNLLGRPIKTHIVAGEKISEFRENLIIDYAEDDETVDEISCPPGCNIVFHDRSIIQDGIIETLSKFDEMPRELHGIVVFLKLGIAVSGYHDGDDSQKNVTFFKEGCWDSFKEKLKPFYVE